MRLAALHPIVSAKPSPLFWFTTIEVLTKPAAGALSRYVPEPECIFKSIWADPPLQIFQRGRLSQALALTFNHYMPEKRSTVEHLPVPVEVVERRIYLIRGQKVMLDSDLADLY